MPPRHTKSDSPLRCSARVLSWDGPPVNAIPCTRPWTVQIDTVRASICQLRHRSSNGWAASGRNAIGLDSARRRRLKFSPPSRPAPIWARSVV